MERDSRDLVNDNEVCYGTNKSHYLLSQHKHAMFYTFIERLKCGTKRAGILYLGVMLGLGTLTANVDDWLSQFAWYCVFGGHYGNTLFLCIHSRRDLGCLQRILQSIAPRNVWPNSDFCDYVSLCNTRKLEKLPPRLSTNMPLLWARMNEPLNYWVWQMARIH